MSRHQSEFTDAQRTAVGIAHISGMSTRAVAAAAEAGTLGVPGFPISPRP